MAEQVKVQSDAQARALMEFAAATRAAEQSAEKASPERLVTNVSRPAGVTYRNGEAVEERMIGQASVSVRHEGVPRGMVRLRNGMVTPVAAAEAAGLMGDVVEFHRDDIGATASFKPSSPQPARAVSEDATGPKTEAATNTLSVGEDAKAAMAKATDALSQATAAHGPIAVQAIQEESITSGELPTELPSGITQDMVDAVVAGYTEQANTILRDSGMNVAGMTELLNANELREARLSVYRSDDAKLRELAGRARERLLSLPKDPVLLRELTADWPKTCRVEKQNDTFVLVTPHGTRSWVEAVTQGVVKF